MFSIEKDWMLTIQNLEAMSFEKLQKIALDIQELLNHKNVPTSIRPVIVAVINELQRRKELLEALRVNDS